MTTPRTQRAAMTLIEVLLVVVLMAILAGLAIPNANPSILEQLRSTAHIVAADLAYARSQAVTYGSDFRVVFSTVDGEYRVEHAGTNPALDDILANPFEESSNASGKYLVVLSELPSMGPDIRLGAVATTDSQGDPLESVSDVVFGPLGETTRSQATRIWLAAGRESSQKTISIRVNPVTGLATVEPPGQHAMPN